MKKIILLAILSASIFACNQKSDQDLKNEAIIKNTQHSTDSIEKRYDRIKTLMEAGMTEEEATKKVDSFM